MTQTRERRRHVVYFTRNTEYHCRDRECVAVRDRRTRHWKRFHPAVRCCLVGGVRTDEKLHRRLQTGAKLVFSGNNTVLTSGLLSSGRPPRESIFYYSSLEWKGTCFSE